MKSLDAVEILRRGETIERYKRRRKFDVTFD